jgi:hypothetical protein
MGRPEVWTITAALKHMGYDVEESGRYKQEHKEAVIDLQKKAGLDEDGVIGRKQTWPLLVKKASEAGFVPEPKRCVQAIVAEIELSHGGRRNDAYGFAENDIGDGAGANYGVVQHNAMGSMRTLLNMAGRDDLYRKYKSSDTSAVNREVKEWMGTNDGIKYQDKYFNKIIWGKAEKYADIIASSVNIDMTSHMPRLMAFMCDIVVQNGSLFSSRRKPYWRSYTSSDPRGKRYQELYTGEIWNDLLEDVYPYEDLKKDWDKEYKAAGEPGVGKRASINEKIVLSALPRFEDPEQLIVFLAQYRSRCSSSRWWWDVMKRKMTFAQGHGKIHGSHFHLFNDFAIL